MKTQRLLVEFCLVCGLVGCRTQSTAIPVRAPSAADSLVLYEAELKLVADDSWSSSERARLRQLLQQGYPALIEIYGPPSSGGSVTIRKTSQSHSGIKAGLHHEKGGRLVLRIEDSISLSEQALQFPSILSHELAHRFHGQSMIVLSQSVGSPRKDGALKIFLHSAIEEGMAQAASNILTRQLGYPFDETHPFQISAEFNKKAFRFKRLQSNQPLYPIRLNLAAWAFEQWERRYPGFLKRFNLALYTLPAAKRPIAYQTCWQVAERLTPGAAAWFKSQEVFRSAMSIGPILYVVGDQYRAGAGLYRREPSGAETLLVGEIVRVTIQVGSRIAINQNFTTNDEGVVPIPFDRPAVQYKITARWRDKADTFTYP